VLAVSIHLVLIYLFQYQYIVLYCIVSLKKYRLFVMYCDIFHVFVVFATNFSAHCITEKNITNAAS